MSATRSKAVWAFLALAVAAVGLGGGYWAAGATPEVARHAPVVETQADPTTAALRVVQELGSSAMYDKSRRDALLTETVDADLAQRLSTGLALAARGLGLDERGASPDGELVARLVPVGHRLLHVAGDRAEVSVWSVGLLGVAGPTSPHPVQASWSTDTLTLRRIGDGWVVTDLAHRDGPAPVSGSQVPASPTELLQHVGEHRSAP